MKVALVTGSFPPDPCGVGAYVERLAEGLVASGVDARVIHGTDWDVRGLRATVRRIDLLQPDLVHIQYPTLGYGAALGPHALSIIRPGIVTLHEMLHTHALRQLAAAAFVASAHHIVLTTPSEREYLLRFAPWLHGRSSVIPVGSSIPAAPSREARPAEVVHFGLIRPEKGLEQVIELAGVIDRHRSSLRVRIVGDVAEKWSGYFRALKASTTALPVTWETGLSSAGVAEILAGSTVGYLPFPDGASERRTSLLALLDAGVATITTRGADTPAALAGAVRFANDPAEAFSIAEALFADREAAEDMRSQGRGYVHQFSWARIVSLHRVLYDDVLRKRRPRSRAIGPVRHGTGRDSIG